MKGVACLLFLCRLKLSASAFIVHERNSAFRASTTPYHSTQTFSLSSNAVQEYFKKESKTSIWDPVKLWDELVSEPVRRHMEYTTPTISLGRQQVIRPNRFADLVSTMKDSIEEASAALDQFISDASMTFKKEIRQALAQQDWRAFLDEDGTGRIYYFNVVTGESRWNPPTSDFHSAEELPLLLVSEGDWASYFDGGNKSIYYFNRKTGQTTWNRPYPTFPRALRNSHARRLASNGDWSAYLDDNNNVYYFNDVTSESSWQPPAGFPNLHAADLFRTLSRTDPNVWFEDRIKNILSFSLSVNRATEIEWFSDWKQNWERQMDKASSTFKDSWSFLDYFGRSKTFSAKEYPFAAIAIAYMDEILSTATSYFPEPDIFRHGRPDPRTKLPTAHPDLDHLTRWKRNSDGTITGSVRHSFKHPEGIEITTSPAIRGSIVAKQNVIRTVSGTKYYLL